MIEVNLKRIWEAAKIGVPIALLSAAPAWAFGEKFGREGYWNTEQVIGWIAPFAIIGIMVKIISDSKGVERFAALAVGAFFLFVVFLMFQDDHKPILNGIFQVIFGRHAAQL